MELVSVPQDLRTNAADLVHELNFILLLDHKYALPKQRLNNAPSILLQTSSLIVG